MSEKLADYFASVPGVLFAYLFGSQARGQAGPLSDIDIAVFLDDQWDSEQRFKIRLQLITDLTQCLRTNDVDVIILNEATTALNYRVLRDGHLVFCRDPLKRILFTAHTVMVYLDFKPMMERHERAILERARKGELLHGYNPHRGSLERYRQRRQRAKDIAESDV